MFSDILYVFSCCGPGGREEESGSGVVFIKDRGGEDAYPRGRDGGGANGTGGCVGEGGVRGGGATK